jgi:hypothetical protein
MLVPGKKSIIAWLCVLTGGAVGLYFITFNIVGLPLTYFPGDLGDGRLNMYFLEHAYLWFTGQLSSFWDAPFMIPEKNVIAYSDNLLGTAPIYAFFRLLGFDNFTAYQWWFISLSALNYLAAWLFLNKLFDNPYAAVIGAMVFAFSMALQSQMTHAQVFPRFAIPLTFMMLVYFAKSLRPVHFFWAVFFVVYQIYCGIYVGFMLFIPAAIFLLLIAIYNKNTLTGYIKDRKWVLHMSLALAANVLLLIPLMIPYMQRSIKSSINHFKAIFEHIPSIKSHFYSQHGSLFWDFLSDLNVGSSAWWDHQIFAGGLATACLIYALGYLAYKHLVKRESMRDNLVHYLIFAGLITMVLHMRFGSLSAYFTVYFIPGFSAIRAVTRIINVELLFFAVATAFVVAKFTKGTSIRSLAVFVFFVLGFLADNYFKEGKSYRTDVSLAKARTLPLEQLMAQIPAHSVISYEPEQMETASIFYQIDAMLASQKHQLKSINAYTGSTPGSYTAFWYNLDSLSRDQWLSGYDHGIDTLYVITSADDFHKVALQQAFPDIHD